MDADQQIVQFARRMRGMRASDLSVLAGVLQSPEPEVNIVTTTGSDNDLLWSEMAQLGWMSLERDEDLPAGSRLFKVHGVGRDQIAKLLDEIRRDAMPDIFNELCRQIPPQIAERVIATGGTPADIALMLAGIVEATMRRWIKPELHDEFLRAVTERTQDLREEFQRRS